MYDLAATCDDALLTYLHKENLIDPATPVVYPATAKDVIGRHVIGKLSHYLSSFTASYTEIPLHLPSGLEGVKLVVADYEKYADNPVSYTVQRRIPV